MKEKRSKFIGISRPIDTEEGFKIWLSNIRKEHPSASHICWAYRITGPLGSYGDLSIGIKRMGGKIILDNSSDQLSFQVRIPRNKINDLIILIRNATQGQGELILEE